MIIVKISFWMAISSIQIRLVLKIESDMIVRGADCLRTVLKGRGNNFFIPGVSKRCFVDCLDDVLDLKSKIEPMKFSNKNNEERL